MLVPSEDAHAINLSCEQESADKKFGNVPAYRAYKSTTRSDSVLFLILMFTLLKLVGNHEA